jgi:hypothetical protein
MTINIKLAMIASLPAISVQKRSTYIHISISMQDIKISINFVIYNVSKVA